jgi:hypothetical protein
MSKPKRKWVDITDLLTLDGVEALRNGKDIGLTVGQVLKFDYEGSETYLRLVRLDRRRGKLWAKEVQLYNPEDVEVVDK